LGDAVTAGFSVRLPPASFRVAAISAAMKPDGWDSACSESGSDDGELESGEVSCAAGLDDAAAPKEL
jgi:hypothetical protein